MYVATMLFEGRVVDLNRPPQPPQRVEFKIAGHRVMLTMASPQHISQLNLGDHVYLACQSENTDRANVLDMIRCKHNETISEADRQAMLDRIGGILGCTEETNGSSGASSSTCSRYPEAPSVLQKVIAARRGV